jgi:hypothetical protein
VPRTVKYLVLFPHAHLTCLLLAAIQLMPLPEEPENRSSHPFGIVRASPDPLCHPPTLGRRDS